MDVSEYDCGIRQEKNKTMKLGDSYSISTDSGYDSIYNSCSSVLMQKSFSRDSFEIFSPNSPSRTPNKPYSALTYHISTPKNNASVKRQLCGSLNTSLSKRLKSENNENDPKTVNSSISKSGQLHDNSFPLKASNNNEFLRQHYLRSSTAVQGSQKSSKNEVFDYKHSTHKFYRENQKEQVLVPERPSKNQRYFTPTVIHSKRKLDILPVIEKPIRMYYNGTKYLNIISRLDTFPSILDDIFTNLTSKDLLHMSLVSKNWRKIVKSNSKANSRIQNYLNESLNIKENHKEPVKLHIANTERHPFGQFNLSSAFNKNTSKSTVNNIFYENQNVVQQLSKNERLVKCPRCSKGSIVSDSSDRLQLSSFTRVPIATHDSQSATSIVSDTGSDSIHVLSKYKIQSEGRKSEYFGMCSSSACKYIFCPKCLCDYHPGENCKISEPESPSKLLICRKNSKLKNKPSCKLSSKRHTLRRLCFQ